MDTSEVLTSSNLYNGNTLDEGNTKPGHRQLCCLLTSERLRVRSRCIQIRFLSILSLYLTSKYYLQSFYIILFIYRIVYTNQQSFIVFGYVLIVHYKNIGILNLRLRYIMNQIKLIVRYGHILFITHLIQTCSNLENN